MRFAKIVFRVAVIWGFVVLTPIYFMESRIGRETPPAISHPEYFYGFLVAALTWQIVFLVVSTDPARYRAIILPSVIEKVSYGIALIVLFLQDRLAISAFSIGSADWIFAVLFIAAYLKIRPDSTQTGS